MTSLLKDEGTRDQTRLHKFNHRVAEKLVSTTRNGERSLGKARFAWGGGDRAKGQGNLATHSSVEFHTVTGGNDQLTKRRWSGIKTHLCVP